ncbi:UNVERIFIED_CONTAM: hypothetical protein FKN15_034114 [Acipenser sinensis]
MLDARCSALRLSAHDAPSMFAVPCSTEMSGFHRCTSDPHDECVACLGPEHAASALADRAFCHLCAGFQLCTFRQRAKKSVGGYSPSSGSSHTVSAPPSSMATPPWRLQLSTSPASQITAGQRSPTRRARARSPSPSRVCPRREARSPSRSPRHRGRSRSPHRDRRCRDRSRVVELTSKMSQFMEVMMGQQSLLMSLANAVPRAPEQLTGPVANQPVAPLQPPLAVSLPLQPQKDWDIDAISRDASDILEGDSIEAEVASLHSDQVAESEVMDTDDPMWSVVDRATRHLGIDWPGTELPRRSLFESPSAQSHQSRMLPAFPDFVKEVQSTLGAPAFAPATSRKASAFTMQGASEAGLASFPLVDAAFATKYYVDVERKEDGFDLSVADRTAVRTGCTLLAPGSLHDRSLKHYFRDSGDRATLRLDLERSGESRQPPLSLVRQQSVRKKIQTAMNKIQFTRSDTASSVGGEGEAAEQRCHRSSLTSTLCTHDSTEEDRIQESSFLAENGSEKDYSVPTQYRDDEGEFNKKDQQKQVVKRRERTAADNTRASLKSFSHCGSDSSYNVLSGVPPSAGRVHSKQTQTRQRKSSIGKDGVIPHSEGKGRILAGSEQRNAPRSRVGFRKRLDHRSQHGSRGRVVNTQEESRQESYDRAGGEGRERLIETEKPSGEKAEVAKSEGRLTECEKPHGEPEGQQTEQAEPGDHEREQSRHDWEEGLYNGMIKECPDNTDENAPEGEREEGSTVEKEMCGEEVGEKCTQDYRRDEIPEKERYEYACDKERKERHCVVEKAENEGKEKDELLHVADSGKDREGSAQSEGCIEYGKHQVGVRVERNESEDLGATLRPETPVIDSAESLPQIQAVDEVDSSSSTSPEKVNQSAICLGDLQTDPERVVYQDCQRRLDHQPGLETQDCKLPEKVNQIHSARDLQARLDEVRETNLWQDRQQRETSESENSAGDQKGKAGITPEPLHSFLHSCLAMSSRDTDFSTSSPGPKDERKDHGGGQVAVSEITEHFLEQGKEACGWGEASPGHNDPTLSLDEALFPPNSLSEDCEPHTPRKREEDTDTLKLLMTDTSSVLSDVSNSELSARSDTIVTSALFENNPGFEWEPANENSLAPPGWQQNSLEGHQAYRQGGESSVRQRGVRKYSLFPTGTLSTSALERLGFKEDEFQDVLEEERQDLVRELAAMSSRDRVRAVRQLPMNLQEKDQIRESSWQESVASVFPICTYMIQSELERQDLVRELAAMSSRDRVRAVRQLPMNLQEKDQIRKKVLLMKTSEKQRQEQNCCTDCSQNVSMSFRRCGASLSAVPQALQLWQGTLKEIGGKFGTSVLSYFLFLKWLLMFNIFSFLVNFGFITVPQLLDHEAKNTGTFRGLEILTGAGYFSNSVLYYGFYSNGTVSGGSASGNSTSGMPQYNMQLAYFFTIGAYLVLCCISLVYSAARSFRENFMLAGAVVGNAGRLLSSWDFSVVNEKAVRLKQDNLRTQLKESLAEKTNENLLLTFSQKLARFGIHVAAWLVSTGMAAGCCAGVYFLCCYNMNLINKSPASQSLTAEAGSLLLPVVVSLINLVIPLLYSLFKKVEPFTFPRHQIYALIIRNVLLKMSILAMLCYFWLEQVVENDNINCWETFVGQDIYRLIIIDFIFCLLGSFFGEFLHKIGIFFSPLLPAIQIIKLFLIFYLKKVSLMQNCQPPKRSWRAAQMMTTFILLLFFPSFSGALSVVAFIVWRKAPSKSCGPFRGLAVPYDAVSQWMDSVDIDFHGSSWAVWIYNNLIKSVLFFLIITLLVLWIVAGRKVLIVLLQEQISNVSLMQNCQPPKQSWRAAQMMTTFILLLFFPSFSGALSVVAFIVWRRAPSKTCGPFRGLAVPYDAVSQWMDSVDIDFHGSSWAVWIYNNLIKSVLFFLILTLLILWIVAGRKVLIILLQEQISNGSEREYPGRADYLQEDPYSQEDSTGPPVPSALVQALLARRQAEEEDEEEGY